GASFAWVSMKVAKFDHVQRQPGPVEPELGDHAAGKPSRSRAAAPRRGGPSRPRTDGDPPRPGSAAPTAGLRSGQAVKLLLSRRDCGGYRGPARTPTFEALKVLAAQTDQRLDGIRRGRVRRLPPCAAATHRRRAVPN